MATSDRTPGTIEIQLTQGQVTVIDAVDADLADFRWYAKLNRCYTGVGKHVVARRETVDHKRVTRYLHRVVLERLLNRRLDRTELVDHIDGNPLNNRRGNLRLATTAQNLANRGKPADNMSGYKGVSLHARSGKWRARIGHNGKQIHIGVYDTPEAAHQAYCEVAKTLHGTFANFG